jgi:hemerythrin superfamily protein
MDAVELIKNDHLRIDELFTEFLETQSEATQEDIYQQILTGLDVHAEMEESVFYPAVKQFAPDQVERSLAEHEEVKQMLAELLDADFDDENFGYRFNKLISDVRQHVKEEEAANGLLELASNRLDVSQLNQMGREMRKIQQRMEADLAA